MMTATFTPRNTPRRCWYCVSYARWRTAEETLRTADHDRRRRPARSSARENRGSRQYRHSADLMRVAGEFGLTPVARSRLAAGIHGQPPGGEFDGLLG